MRYENSHAPQAHLSRRFYEAVKLSSERACRLAVQADLDPATFSKMLHRVRKVRTNDPRILKIARALRVNKSELFDRN